MTKVDVKKDPTYRLTKEGKVYRRGRKKFANLDVYDGEFLDGAKHGLGRLAVYCGDVYQGEFENNMFHGTGIYTWSDHTIEETGVVVTGKKYEGHWRDGKMHGKGAWILGKGQGSYSGEFDKGAYHGFGTLKCGNGDSFEGNWVRGLPGGVMKRTVAATGDIWDGVMRQGKRHGKGRQTFGQGRGYYEGDWERDKPHGNGIRVYSNGSKFVGNLQDGEVHGDGTMFYANGDQYIGRFFRGHLSGRGVMKYARGESFDGNFLNGFPYGEGKYTYSDGGYYDGEYKATKINKGTLLEAPLCNGKRDGFGLRVFTNGSRYTGQWLDDKMHGQGQMLQAEGAGYEGAFFNGYRQGPGREQYGNILGIPFHCPQGHFHPGTGYCQYKGNWVRDHWHGKGEYVCCDGRLYSGEFQWGKKHGMGTQEYLRTGDQGDVYRQCIGGRGSMYRYLKYEGNWEDGVKEGHGTLFFVNTDTISGLFEHGQPHGLMKVTFSKSKRIRWARYERGTRMEWVKESKALGKATQAITMFHTEALVKAG
jgi:hypothetical protein